MLILRIQQTQLARAIAGEAQAAFFTVAPSDVLSKFVGESEAAIRSIFRKAREAASRLQSKCSVIFFDEIDALGHTRENGGSGEGEGCSRRVLAELLLQFNTALVQREANPKDRNDKTEEYDEGGDYVHVVRVLLVAATNRPEDCDPALLRRFGIRMKVGLPSCRDREKMFTNHLTGILHELSRSDLRTLALSTEGWSGSDLESLAREAAMAPIRECLRAAALHRRRILREWQVSAKDSVAINGAPSQFQDSAQQLLLETLENLRPVRMEDFENAIFTLSKGEPGSRNAGQYSGPKRFNSHYDSSSDEEAL